MESLGTAFCGLFCRLPVTVSDTRDFPMSSFATLLRTSKFASYDAKLPQIYKTISPLAQYGDFGLKRNLPASFKSRLVTISELDTPERLTEFESARGDYYRVKRL